jgi:hypothetical protein
MKNVILSFGDYPTIIDADRTVGPYSCQELGLMWLDWVAEFSPEQVKKYHLVVITPQKTVLPDSVNAWQTVTRFNENSGVTGWPDGPNAVFKQVQWFYYHKRLSGAFLWCEPDCIPVSADWLDLLSDEYVRSYKPFMGGLVDVRSTTGVRTPPHMTGNGIYPERAYSLAPALMEAHKTPWDVYAAQQILRQAHITHLIQHDYRHPKIKSTQELRSLLHPSTVLFHSDKYGAIIELLGKRTPLPSRLPEPDRNSSQNVGGKTLVEVFQSERELITLSDFALHNILTHLKDLAGKDKSDRSLIANFMVNEGIVNAGHVANHYKKVRKEKALNALAEANPR